MFGGHHIEGGRGGGVNGEIMGEGACLISPTKY